MADVNQLMTALNAKGVNNACSSCGANDWGTMSSLLQAGLDDSGGLNIGTGIPVLTMICNNCGFVRLHAEGALSS